MNFSSFPNLTLLDETFLNAIYGKDPSFDAYRVIGFIVTVFVIVLNLSVLISSCLIIKCGNEPKALYLFYGNIALSDLTVGLMQISLILPSDKFFCALKLGILAASLLCSVYTVGLIAIDRYLFILHGLYYQRWLSAKRAKILIVCVWILGVSFGLLPLYIWSIDERNGYVCMFLRLVPKEVFFTGLFVGAIPVVFTTVLYSLILCTMLKRVSLLKKATVTDANTLPNAITPSGLRIFRGGSQVLHESQGERKTLLQIFAPRKDMVKSSSDWRAIKVVLLTNGSFLITMVPFLISHALLLVCDENTTPEKCKSILVAQGTYIGFLNSLHFLINPLIYAWWNKGFRKLIRKRFAKSMESKKVAAFGRACTFPSRNTSSSKSTSTTDSSLHI